MSDFWHKVTTLADHYRYSAVAVGLAVVAACTVLVQGCRPLTITDPSNPSQTINADQLDQVYASLQEQVQGRFAAADKAAADAAAFAASVQIKVDASADELARKQAERAALLGGLQTLAGQVATLAPPPYGTIIAGALATLLGVGSLGLNAGLAADGRRKDRELKKRSTPPSLTT